MSHFNEKTSEGGGGGTPCYVTGKGVLIDLCYRGVGGGGLKSANFALCNF